MTKYNKQEIKNAWDLAQDIKDDASTEFLLQATCDILKSYENIIDAEKQKIYLQKFFEKYKSVNLAFLINNEVKND